MAEDTIKTAVEIGTLASELTPQNQTYILGAINALLYGQLMEKIDWKNIEKASIIARY